jgi:hypothetical protein
MEDPKGGTLRVETSCGFLLSFLRSASTPGRRGIFGGRISGNGGVEAFAAVGKAKENIVVNADLPVAADFNFTQELI